jgi:hypothetical protein
MYFDLLLQLLPGCPQIILLFATHQITGVAIHDSASFATTTPNMTIGVREHLPRPRPELHEHHAAAALQRALQGRVSRDNFSPFTISFPQHAEKKKKLPTDTESRAFRCSVNRRVFAQPPLPVYITTLRGLCLVTSARPPRCRCVHRNLLPDLFPPALPGLARSERGAASGNRCPPPGRYV